jgi:hypothetical protein
MATTATGAFAGVNLTISFAGVGAGTPAYQAWLDKLTLLERFNGQTFLPVPVAGTTLSDQFLQHTRKRCSTSHINRSRTRCTGHWRCKHGSSPISTALRTEHRPTPASRWTTRR